MLDYPLRRAVNPILDMCVPFLARCGMTANMVTGVGFLFGLLVFISIIFGKFYLAILFLFLNRLCDGLDGRLARYLGNSGFGAYFDIVCDFLFYGLVPLGFVILDSGANGLAGSFLLFSFLGSGASFMMFSVLGRERGLESIWGDEKGFYFAFGLIEGSETILFFVLVLLFWEYFAILSWVFGGLCLVTVAVRVWVAYRV